MATPGSTPKTMSSRLLTMKFMQRSAAAADQNSSQPAAKKQRLSNGSSISTPTPSPRVDSIAIREAVAAEERQRAEALDREGAIRGETRWYLSYNAPQAPPTASPLRIVTAGYSALDGGEQQKGETDSEEEDDELEEYRERPQVKVSSGRRTFGAPPAGQKVVEQQKECELSPADPDDSDNDGGEEEGEVKNPPTKKRAHSATGGESAAGERRISGEQSKNSGRRRSGHKNRGRGKQGRGG